MGLLGMFGPPFDTSKPNFHDSKSDFLEEKILVEEALKAANQLSRFLVSAAVEDTADHDVTNRIAKCVDATVRQNRSGSGISDLADMMRNNASDLGACWIMAFQIYDVIEGLSKRKQELIDQEVNFWNVSSRPPNHYARAIALRFARLIAKNTGEKPTFGTSKDGGHPSTDFGRALEEVFELLGITAQVKNPAVWAIGQLTEEDCTREVRNSLRNPSGGLAMARGVHPDLLANLAAGRAKGEES